MSRIIQGGLYIQPQAVAFVDDSALGRSPIGASGIMCVIGEAFGGQPKTPLLFESPALARRILRSGDLMTAVQRAFLPGPGIQGAPRVYAIRANPGSQSQLTLRSGLDPELATPEQPTATPSESGGTLGAGGKSYRVAARDANGSTLASIANASPAVITGSTGSVVVDWPDVSGATSYDVYGRVGGNIHFLANVSTSTYTDDGSDTPTTQAVPDINSSGSPSVMNLFSTDYGAHTQQVRVKIEDAPGGLGKRLTVQYGNTINTRQQVFRKGLDIRLVDDDNSYVSATAEVTTNNLVIHLVPTTGDPIDYTISLGAYQSLQAVAEAVNNLGSAVACAVAAPTPAADPSLFLDETDAPVDIRVVSAQSPGTILWSNREACYDWFTRQAGLLTAIIGVNDRRLPPVNTDGWAYLGSDDPLHLGTDYGRDDFGVLKETTFVQDFSDAMDAALPIEVSIITVANPDETLHGMLQAHVSQASSPQGKHERVFVIGGDIGETIESTQGRADRIRDPRCMLVYPSIVDRNPDRPFTGDQVFVPPYLVASQLAGMFCALPPAAALTHKFIAAQALERKLTSDEIDLLLEWGVAPVEAVANRGFRVVQSRSTWIADENYRWNEISVMRASDEIVRRVRGACDERLVGEIVGPDLLRAAVSLTDSVLRHCQQDGLIVGVPAFRNIVATANGDLVTIDFEASIAIPANFIAITAHFTPFTGVLTQA